MIDIRGILVPGEPEMRIHIVNDRTGDVEHGNYNCELRRGTVDGWRLVRSARVEGHVRAEGWLKLLALAAEALKGEES